MGSGAPELEPSSTAFSGHEQRAGSEVEQQGLLELAPIRDAGAVVSGLSVYATKLLQ